jgi:hypothetical protein
VWTFAPEVGVYVTEHCELSVSDGTDASVQVAAENVPVPLPARANDTVPEGFELVPGAVSSTTALQVEAWFSATVAGVQVTVVVVERSVAVTVSESLLVACVAVPPYVAVTVWALTPVVGV